MKTLLTLAAAATVALTTTAVAQQQLTRNQIIESLARTEATVGAIDPQALQAEAQRRAAQGGGNAPDRLSDDLTKVPQISVEVNFDRGSARIKPSSYRAVGLIADALHTPYLLGQRVVLVGHTDATGTREFNLKLSIQRAESVLDALTTTFHVPRDKLSAIGLGEEQLQDMSNPDSGVNRRVQLINLGP